MSRRVTRKRDSSAVFTASLTLELWATWNIEAPKPSRLAASALDSFLSEVKEAIVKVNATANSDLEIIVVFMAIFSYD